MVKRQEIETKKNFLGSLKPKRTLQKERNPRPVTHDQSNNNGCRIDLPADVIDNIFSFLPMNTVRLIGERSRRFKRSYISNRHLNFDRKFAKGWKREDYTKFINHIKSFHSCHKVFSLKLFLHVEDDEHYKVEDWIDFAARKAVEDLDLEFAKRKQRFKFPTRLLNNISVTSLKLSFCELNPPSDLKRLHSLRTLFLYKVRLNEETFQVIFSDCTFLENLTLKNCSMLGRLEIPTSFLKLKILSIVDCLKLVEAVLGAPNLSSFHFSGKFSKITFSNEDALKVNLRDAVLRFTGVHGWEQLGQFRKLMLDLSHVEVLTVNSTVIECLAPNMTAGMLNLVPFILDNLKEFQLLMEPMGAWNSFEIAFFLTKCPNLEKVFIDLRGFSFHCEFYSDLCEQHLSTHFNYAFPHLKYVKFEGFKYNTNGTQLLHIFLDNASVLETMVLVSPRKKRKNSREIAAEDRLNDYYVEELNRAYLHSSIVACEESKDTCELQPTHDHIRG
ncbi:putative FBD-associated F-box protein At1g61330 [Tasmannia lanceolata]|uniref:putative FBD-associated F-box protein At1g61330 n=1 Tax=Tasmannia lanceolata TaxID=3420 RepID=UPI004064C1BA